MAASEITTLGKYLLIERLHLGDRGETFVARDQDSKEGVVSVKRLLPKAAEDKEQVADFLLMAHQASPLKHEAICAVLDFGSVDGAHYLAREYVGGKDLRDLQRRHVLQRRLIPEPVALYIAKQLAEALVHVHEAASKGAGNEPRLYGKAHPRDVLLGFGGEVKLIGFGLQQKDSEGGTDVRQFGATLYELLTGKAPALEEKPKPPSELRSSVSKELEKLIMQALGANGSFGSVVELKKALDAYLKGVPDAVGRPADLSALMKRIFAGALRIEKERARRVSTAAAPKAQAPAPAPAAAPNKAAPSKVAQSKPPAKAPPSKAAAKSSKPAGATAGGASKPKSKGSPGRQAVTPVAAATEPAGGKGMAGYIALAAGILMLIAGGVFFATAGSGDPAAAVAADGPGQLQVVSAVPVELILDGGDKQSVPFEQAVSPGRHGLTIVFGNQRRLEREVEVKPGETVKISLQRGGAS